MSEDNVKRTISQELTAVIPREHLPPISTKQIEAMGLDPEHEETKALLEQARETLRNRPTLVPCPAGCQTCSACQGRGMITPEEAAEWRIQQAEAKSIEEEIP